MIVFNYSYDKTTANQKNILPTLVGFLIFTTLVVGSNNAEFVILHNTTKVKLLNAN